MPAPNQTAPDRHHRPDPPLSRETGGTRPTSQVGTYP